VREHTKIALEKGQGTLINPTDLSVLQYTPDPAVFNTTGSVIFNVSISDPNTNSTVLETDTNFFRRV
jgi:hypothetical protein